jgi:hypothetical protein
MHTDKIRRMRLLAIFIAAAARLFAQPSPTDPEYAIPKNNPFTAPVELHAGEKFFSDNAPDATDPKERARLNTSEPPISKAAESSRSPAKKRLARSVL